MLITKVVLVLVFTILQSQTDAKLLDGVSAEYQTVSDIYIRLEEILKSCFLSRLSTLVITSDLNEVIPGILNDSVAANMLVLDENFNPLQSHRNFPRWPIFVLTANSTVRLSRMLQQLKRSAFWHAESTFIIVDVPKGGCDETSSMLWTSWEMDLLASFYICEDVERGVMLNTYNPFTNRAPAPWNKVETMSDGRWTLYNHPVSKGHIPCKLLEFNKAEFLDGCKVNAAAIVLPGVEAKDHSTLSVTNLTKTLFYENAMTYSVLFSKMNVTPIITVDSTIYQRTDDKHYVFSDKFDEKAYDILMFSTVLNTLNEKNHGFTYPNIMGSLSILTKHREFLTPAEKIGNFYRFEAMSLTGLVFLITWILFAILKGEKMAAALEVLRMALSTGVLQRLHKTSIRIYLFGPLWLVLILNATFQGNMSLFLTKPTRIDIETIKNLNALHLRLYVGEIFYPSVRPYLTNIPNSHLKIVKDPMCHSYVVNNSKAACLQPLGSMLSPAMTYDLHISHEPVVNVHRTYPYRKGWPLASKINVYMSQLMASGLLHHWRDKMVLPTLGKLAARETQATDPVIRKIKLVDLNFAFIILGIGLTISTLFFVVEVGGNPTKKRTPRFVKRPQQPRRRIIRPNNAVHMQRK